MPDFELSGGNYRPATLEDLSQQPELNVGSSRPVDFHDIWNDESAPPAMRQEAANQARWQATVNPANPLGQTANMADLMTIPKMIPMGGRIINTLINRDRKLAQDRIDAGKGTSDDYWTVAGAYEQAMSDQQRSASQKRLPGYMPDPMSVGKTGQFMAELYLLKNPAAAVSEALGGGLLGTAGAVGTEATLSGMAAEQVAQRGAPYVDARGQTQSVAPCQPGDSLRLRRCHHRNGRRACRGAFRQADPPRRARSRIEALAEVR
jgi:hypothetical protein